MPRTFPVEEILEAHERCRAALSVLDFDVAIRYFSEDAMFGNSMLGVYPGKRAGIQAFMDHKPVDHGYECIWKAVDSNTVRWKWHQWFPGIRPNGKRYEYSGYCEARYVGNGKFDCWYSFPDIATVKQILIDWEKDKGKPYMSNRYDALHSLEQYVTWFSNVPSGIDSNQE